MGRREPGGWRGSQSLRAPVELREPQEKPDQTRCEHHERHATRDQCSALFLSAQRINHLSPPFLDGPVPPPQLLRASKRFLFQDEVKFVLPSRVACGASLNCWSIHWP